MRCSDMEPRTEDDFDVGYPNAGTPRDPDVIARFEAVARAHAPQSRTQRVRVPGHRHVFTVGPLSYYASMLCLSSHDGRLML